MDYDIWVSGYTDPFTGELRDLGVKDGIITYNGRFYDGVKHTVRAKETVTAAGRLVLPGLVESHIHLDKAFLTQRMSREADSLSDAIGMTAALKKDYTFEDIMRRSVAVIERSMQAGVTHLRCQVEVDPIIGLLSMEAALQLKELYRSLMTIQLVVFPQEGIFQQEGTEELMRQAVAMGADAIGGIPYNDTDAREHLEWIFKLAEETGLPVDLHVDFSDDPSHRTIVDIADLTIAYGLQGRVTVAHLTSLGSMESDDARVIASKMAAAGIHVITLPATDLYLNGRGDSYKPRRGLTPVRLLLEEGVNVCFGSNNIRNAFTPFGKGDPLDIALLLGQTAYMGTRADAVLLLEMCTTRAARALNLEYGALACGSAADFLLTGASDICDLIYDRTPERIVWKNGLRTAETALNKFVISPEPIVRRA
ncbi:amidohydrolase family protein [Paenibacillus sp. YIM B09110]|uniref:amidohydrolase family protein n=1 Tax=Paenibacillus sp. YIM B09110 TaxID=3126102 RepID=UPI00301C82CF